MQYNAVIEVRKGVADVINGYMSMTGTELYDKYGLCKDETMTFTAEFENGFFADIKVVIADEDSKPYIDPVLFDESGHEVQILDVCDAPLEGEYEFSFQGNEYSVNLISV